MIVLSARNCAARVRWFGRSLQRETLNGYVLQLEKILLCARSRHSVFARKRTFTRKLRIRLLSTDTVGDFAAAEIVN